MSRPPLRITKSTPSPRRSSGSRWPAPVATTISSTPSAKQITYALYGIFASCRPATIDVNVPARQREGTAAAAALKEEVRGAMARAWLARLEQVPERLRHWQPPDDQARAAWLAEETGPLAAWVTLKDLPAEKWPGQWKRLHEKWESSQRRLAEFRAQAGATRWDLRGPDFSQWQSQGAGVAQGPTPAGEFSILAEGEHVLGGIYSGGVYSNLLSERLRGLLASPRFSSQGGKLWLRVRGGGDAKARYVVRNYPPHRHGLSQAGAQGGRGPMD